jgi:hypothetical protein
MEQISTVRSHAHLHFAWSSCGTSSSSFMMKHSWSRIARGHPWMMLYAIAMANHYWL